MLSAPFQRFSLFFCLLTVPLGFFLLPSLDTDLLPQTAEEEEAGTALGGIQPCCPRLTLMCDLFAPVQEELRAEVQGGGRGRAVLRTHQRHREPQANRKGTEGGKGGFTLSRYKRIQLIHSTGCQGLCFEINPKESSGKG